MFLSVVLLFTAVAIALFEWQRLRDHGSPIGTAAAVKTAPLPERSQDVAAGAVKSPRQDSPSAEVSRGKQMWAPPKDQIATGSPASPAQKIGGRRGELDLTTVSSLTGLSEGDEITIPGFEGQILTGRINRRQVEASGLVMVGGQLNGAQEGTFAFSLGSAGFHGSILLPDKAVAYVAEQTSEGGAAKLVLVEKKLSEVVCFPLPKYAPKESLQNDEPAGGSGGTAGSFVVPVLSSRPTATAVMYMDLDGESVTDPSWNGGRTIDAKPSSLTAEQIVDVWHRVSEDYVGFEIDVTTDVRRYNAAPVGRRMRCIVTPTDTAARGAGGVAYLNSFAEAGKNFSDTIPCWVFNPGVIGVSEAVSHEFGHTFGLRHDGRSSPQEEYYYGQGEGALGWAPIMGVGYYKNVVQWSKGEYAFANNQEDDVAVIASPINAFGFSADETGDTIATAAPLPAGVLGQISQDGVIHSWADLDVYKFTAPAGLVQVEASPAANSPDLDIVLELKDAGGSVLASSNPDLALNASINHTLVTGGTYYLNIKGTGHGDAVTDGYSNYGSTGAYSLRGEIPTGDGIPFVESGLGVTLPRYIAANYQIPAANSPTLFSATGLPAGMTLNSSTGALSGIPTAPAGNYTVVVTLTNARGSRTGSFVVTLTPEPVPTVTAATVTLARLGKSFSLGITATALPNSYSATGLPAGLVLNTTTGMISGTPTVAGIYAVTVTATNATGTGNAGFSMVIVSDGQQVAGCETHSLFVRNDGTLWGTGANYTGQLGDGTSEAKTVPVKMATGVSSVAAGYGFSLYLKADGNLWAVGENAIGQLGDGSGTSKTVAVQIGTGVAAIAAGHSHSLFLKTDGTLWAMGANDHGQVGDGSTTSRLSPVLVASAVSSVAAGGKHSLFVKTDGTLWVMGYNANGQLGDGTKEDRLTPVQVAAGVFSASGGPTGSLFVKADATLWGMGYNGSMQLKGAENGDQPTPVLVAEGVIGSLAGASTSTFLKADGTLWFKGSDGYAVHTSPVQIDSAVSSFATNSENLLYKTADGRFWGKGQNQSGWFGDGGVTVRTMPVLVAENVISIVAGSAHSLFVKGDGTLWACGYNGSGQLGDGSQISRGTAVEVAADVLRASGGVSHSLFIKTDGILWGMGSRYDGQLKYLSNTPQTVPLVLESGVTAIAAGADYSLLIKTDGSLLAMGANSNGQLGDGTKTRKANGVLIANGVAAVTAGSLHSLFVKTDGTLWAMGWNNAGQLGDGSTTDRATPVQVASAVSQVAASDWHSLFLKTDGTLWAMGDNRFGQLGDGTNIDRHVPIQVASGVLAMAANQLHSYFIKSDGNLWAMGDAFGLVPKRIARGMKKVAAGGNHALFLKTDDTVWAMGDNYSGQLGDGLVTYYVSPVEIKPGRPSITAQTMPFEVILGGSVTFAVSTAGEGTLTYQWRKDGVAISGATGASCAVTGAQSSHGGRYDVVVTSSVGSVISSAGDLSVIGATPQFTSANTVTAARLAPVSFLVKAANDATLFAASGLPAGLMMEADSGLISGVATGAVGTYPVTLTATNSQGSTSSILTVTVSGESAPVITSGMTVVGHRGVPLQYAIKATSVPQNFGATGLPGGLVVNASTGAITGIPTDAPGVYAVTVSAANAVGTGSMTVRMAVLPEGQNRVSVGVYNSFFLDDDGSLYAAGYNYYGQMGEGDAVDRGAAILVASDVAAVAASFVDTVFLKTDGTLWGMGWNIRGELGNGNTVQQNFPVYIAKDVIAAEVGFEHCLFLKSDGGLWAVGGNTFGQLGDGTTIERLQPVLIANNVQSLSVHAHHSLFVKTDGTLWGMGVNNWGQLGDGTTEDRHSPVLLAVGVKAVSASTSGSLFLKNDGSLWGSGFNGMSQIRTRAESDDIIETRPVKMADNVTVLGSGSNQNLYITADGTLWGRGWNAFAQLGDEETQFDLEPRPIATGVVACGSGYAHSIYRKTDGSLWTLGTSTSGELADGYDPAQPIPLQVASDVSLVAAGADHSLFVARDGTLWGMGYNGLGSLGDGTITDRVEPVKVLGDVARVATHFWHSLIVKNDGSLWAMGNNGDGELGIGSVTINGITAPVQVDSGVKRVATGGWHSLYLKNDGTAWAMGANVDGQLGDGTNIQRPLPVQVMNNVADVVAGYRHSFFLKTDGTLWASGLNEMGQLGDGTKINRQNPVQVATNVAQIAAGAWHSLFIKTDGTMWAMGLNQYGQLGDGATAEQPLPILIDGGVRSVTAGALHTQYLKQDGTLWAMGYNAVGQLGDTNEIARTESVVRKDASTGANAAPRFVSTRSGRIDQPTFSTDRSAVGRQLRGSGLFFPGSAAGLVPRVVASAQFPGQAATPGMVMLNSAEFLGNGTTLQQTRPVQIATGIAAASAGSNHSLYVRNNGSLWAMGQTLNGRLGHGASVVHWQAGQVQLGRPVILAQSIPFAVRLNERANFSVNATGGGALSYQWRKNGQPIGGATNSRYALSAVVAADGGVYDVVVANNQGSQACTAVNMSVLDALPVMRSSLALSVPRMSDGFSYQIDANNDVTGYAATGLLPGLSLNPTTGLITGKISAVEGVYPITLIIYNANGSSSVALNVTVTPQAVPTLTSVRTILGRRGQTLRYNTSAQNSPESFAAAGLPAGLTMDSLTGAISGRITGPAGRSTVTVSATNISGSGNAQLTFIILPESAGLSAAENCSLVVDNEGVLWGMGENGNGELGDGTNVNRASPTKIATNVVAVSSSDFCSMFLKADGTLWGAGANTFGLMGPAIPSSSLSPIQIASRIQACSTRYLHGLYLDWDGVLWASGRNDHGQLGDGTQVDRSALVQVATGVDSISAGSNHSLFVKQDGTLWGMGQNADGELGDGTTTDRSTPIQIAIGVRSASAAVNHTLFVKTDSTLWAVGNNREGKLGDATYNTRLTPVQVGSGVARAFAGPSDSLYLDSSGNVFGMGENSYGQLLDGSGAAPTLLTTGITGVSAGTFHSLLINSQGDYLAVGINNSGQLGDPTETQRTLPVKVAEDVTQVTGGYYHTMFAKDDRSLWGMGMYAQAQRGVGINSGLNSLNMAAAPGVAPVMDVSAQTYFTLFLDRNQTLWGIGQNNYGEIGGAPNGEINVPWQISTQVVSVVAGNDRSFFIKTDGTLWSSGQNYAGGLGDGTKIQRPDPVKVAENVVKVAVGTRHTLFLKTDGSLWGMGSNGYHEVIGTVEGDIVTPIQIATSVATMAAGDMSSFFVKTDGTLWSMGRNDYGQLGIGTKVAAQNPVQIASGVSAVSASDSDHSLFLKSDGTMWAMGSNVSGQLGDGTEIPRLSPVLIAVGVKSIAAAYYRTFLVKQDHSLWAAGSNSNGRLGLGFSISRKEPVKIALGTPVVGSISVPVGASLGGTALFSVSAAGNGVMSYQWRKDGRSIVGATGSGHFIGVVTAADGGVYDVIVTGSDGSTIAPSGSMAVINAPPVIIGVLSAQGTKGTPFVYRVTANNDASIFGASDLPAGLTINPATGLIEGTPTASGRHYLVSLSAANKNGTGQAVLDLDLQSAPGITTQPVSQVVTYGNAVTITAAADGSPAPAFQWKKYGGNVSGATSATLSIASVQMSDAGSYTLVATNSLGSVTSNAAALTVNKAAATVALGSLSPTYDGSSHAATATTMPASLAVAFTYDGSTTTPTNAGTYSVVGTINHPNYQGSASGSLTISKATPLVTWGVPAAIFYGTPLSIVQLNATANVPGAFSYSPAIGQVLSVGDQMLTCLFTPTDASNYNGVSVLRMLTVRIDDRIPAGFDVAVYLARYPELAAIYGSDYYGAWLYYHDQGIYQGQVYDELFRVEEYLTLYPELFTIFGNDLGGALMHWLTQGRIEGKLGRIPLEFKAQGYFDRNPDVATAVGNDPILAWGHYWLYGIYEGRAYDDELRVFEYLAINADLTAAFVNDWRQAALHWMRYGRTEGRLGRLPLTFNVSEYLVRSPDVAATWGTNPTTVFLHYWAYGIDESRTYDDLFRPNEYLALNPDLAAALGTDRRLAFKHWVRYGQTEGRPGRNP